jgi:hypothetical protein
MPTPVFGIFYNQWDNPLLPCRVKTLRARKHFGELQQFIQTLSQTHKSHIGIEDNKETRIYTLYAIDPLPPELSGFIGDVVHNLRAAMDSLAVALVTGFATKPVTNEMVRDTEFPVGSDPKLSSKRKDQFFANVGPAIEKVVRKLEPYKGGRGDKFFSLHQLDIMDKHRSIIPVWARFSNVTMSGSMGVGIEHGVFTATKRIGLRPGDELGRSVAPDGLVGFKPDARFTFEIAFGEGQEFEGEPVLRLLMECIHRVEGAINIFARDIFKHVW